MSLVSPGLHILTGIEVGAPLAVVVDLLDVGDERSPLAVGLGKSAEGEEMDDSGHEVVGVHRATREVYQGDTGYRLPYSHRAGGVGGRGGKPAIGRTGSHGYGGQGVAAEFPCDIQGRSPADTAVCAVVPGGDGSLHDDDVLPSPLLHRLRPCFLGQDTGGGHDGLRIVNGEYVQDDLRHRGGGGPKERLGVAGTALKLQPDHRWSVVTTQRLGHPGDHGRRERQSRRHGRAELDEITP